MWFIKLYKAIKNTLEFKFLFSFLVSKHLLIYFTKLRKIFLYKSMIIVTHVQTKTNVIHLASYLWPREVLRFICGYILIHPYFTYIRYEEWYSD